MFLYRVDMAVVLAGHRHVATCVHATWLIMGVHMRAHMCVCVCAHVCVISGLSILFKI